MIEFIIPLNLPVRAVEITETMAGPPASFLQEMKGWLANHSRDSSRDQRSLMPFPGESGTESSGFEPRHEASEVEQELESLRMQRSLFTEAARELKQVTRTFDQQLAGIIREFQEATIELSQSIAAKLIFEEIDGNRFPIANLVHEVVGRLDTNADAVVRLHPDDLAIIQQSPPIDDSGREYSIRFVGDSSLARGDCKAKAGEITVIYELRRQIDEIRRQLLSTVGGHAES